MFPITSLDKECKAGIQHLLLSMERQLTELAKRGGHKLTYTVLGGEYEWVFNLNCLKGAEESSKFYQKIEDMIPLSPLDLLYTCCTRIYTEQRIVPIF